MSFILRPTMDPFGTLSEAEVLTRATSVVEPFRTFFCKATAFRAWRVVRIPVSTSRSKRCPDRDLVSWRCTQSSKSSSSFRLIKQFNINKNRPKPKENKPVHVTSFHQAELEPAIIKTKFYFFNFYSFFLAYFIARVLLVI